MQNLRAQFAIYAMGPDISTRRALATPLAVVIVLVLVLVHVAAAVN